MDLKNALAVCLISLFSATLVVLIARALDRQAMAPLEPQLAKIAEELQTLRKQGGIPAASGNAIAGDSLQDGLLVYYFHSNVRCPTCRSIESQSLETVRSEFATQLETGQIAWRILNYEQPSGADLAKQFEIQMPVIVVARMKDGKIDDWKRLDEVWARVGDKPAFAQLISSEINQMLEGSDILTASAAPPDIPVPEPDLQDIPIPSASDDANGAQ